MEVGKRDLIVRILNEQVDILQTKNVERMKELGERQKDNEFLSRIYEDYQKNYFYMYQVKQQQQRQIEYLVGYLDKSLQTAGLSHYMIEQATFEKRRLQEQIEKIQRDLDRMIEKDKILLGQ